MGLHLKGAGWPQLPPTTVQVAIHAGPGCVCDAELVHLDVEPTSKYTDHLHAHEGQTGWHTPLLQLQPSQARIWIQPTQGLQ